MIKKIKSIEGVLDVKSFPEKDGSKTLLVYTAWECKRIKIKSGEDPVEKVKEKLNEK